MKNKPLVLTFALGGLLLVNSLSAQTYYGKSVRTVEGNTTTYTCPQNASTVCQTWGTNADGTRYAIVTMPDGETIPVNVRLAEADPSKENPGRFIFNPDEKVWYKEVTIE